MKRKIMGKEREEEKFERRNDCREKTDIINNILVKAL